MNIPGHLKPPWNNCCCEAPTLRNSCFKNIPAGIHCIGYLRDPPFHFSQSLITTFSPLFSTFLHHTLIKEPSNFFFFESSFDMCRFQPVSFKSLTPTHFTPPNRSLPCSLKPSFFLRILRRKRSDAWLLRGGMTVAIKHPFKVLLCDLT